MPRSGIRIISVSFGNTYGSLYYFSPLSSTPAVQVYSPILLRFVSYSSPITLILSASRYSLALR